MDNPYATDHTDYSAGRIRTPGSVPIKDAY